MALLDGRFQVTSTSADRMLRASLSGVAAFALLGRIATEEGRAADPLPALEDVLATRPDLHSGHAWLGCGRLDTGDRAGAAEVLDHLVSNWTGWARDLSWPATLTQTAEIVAGLEATEHAEGMADELSAYAGELAVGSMIFCMGAFDRYRGMLLSLLGRHDDAVAALDAALALEESVEAPTLTARTRYWLARALRQRDGPSDRERADAVSPRAP